MKPVLNILFIVWLSAGCSRLAPELGFGSLKIANETLTINSSSPYINDSLKSSSITLSGICETNLNIVLTVKEPIKFKCVNESYSQEVSSEAFSDGINMISVKAFDDSDNEMASKQMEILKDTVFPDVSLTAPSNVGPTVTEVSLSGSCSENQLDVLISESIYSEQQAVKCENGNWSYNHNIAGKTTATEFKFMATHKDIALNEFTTSSTTVIRTGVFIFSILGVSNTSGVLNGFSSLLKSSVGSMTVGWTSDTDISTYDLAIKRNVSSTPLADITIGTTLCSFSNLVNTNHSFSLSSGCAGILPGDNLVAEVTGWDSTHQISGVQRFAFRVKQAPGIQLDAGLLYVNSSWTSNPTEVAIPYSQIVLDPDSSGPFSISITDSGGLDNQLVVDNSSGQQLRVIPLENSSGVFTTKIKISDENGVQSAEKTVKIAIVLPYSWAGLVDNNFNNKSNWCGTAGLKSGCAGNTIDLSNSTRIVIDNLCNFTRQNTSCSPTLSSSTSVRSILFKSENFRQSSQSLTVGAATGEVSYFVMTGGIFNSSLTSGDMTIYTKFQILGGTFNAPSSSNIHINTIVTPHSSEPFKVSAAAIYNHNNSSLFIDDSEARNLNQFLPLAEGTKFYNLTINTTGGRWTLDSNDLIVENDLTLSGSYHSGTNFYPLLDSKFSTSKITLKGNLNCEGQFGGGKLPIHMIRTSTYKSMVTGCKFPFIKIDAPGISVSEDSTSIQETIVQGLVILAGNFSAPSGGRNLRIKSDGLADNILVADLSTGFTQNGSDIIFETADDSKNYKIKLGTVANVGFINPNNRTSFYDIQTDFVASTLSFLGTNLIPLRGQVRNIYANQLVLDTGLVSDSNRLNKVTITSTFSAFSNVIVNTESAINIKNIHFPNSITFGGSSDFYNFAGTIFDLGSSTNVSSSSTNVFHYLTKTGNGSFGSAGQILDGM